MAILTAALGPLLHPGREQGVAPDVWEPKHAAAYVANGVVICIVAPFVEELAFRGLGYSLLVRFGRWTAIVLVGVAFGLAHGLVEAFPFLAAFGAGLVHGLFNATALAVAVSGKPQQENILHACAGVWSSLLF
jgi:membrane protease YdiL (CAAX protease family)